MKPEKRVFKQGSTTYYYSSMFFPKSVRRDVFKLYSFVRIADDYVDKIPQDVKAFRDFRRSWRATSKKGGADLSGQNELNQHVIENMEYLISTYGFERQWVDDFLDAMESDIDHRPFKSMTQSLRYVYGSAEVVGLMMTKIMSLPDNAFEAAKLQGRAMQWINFIRDVDEDNLLNRRYFPASLLDEFGLKDLSRETAKEYPDKFASFMRSQIDLYREWQNEAQKGYKYIPRRYLIPLKTASDMYNWTAQQIYEDPAIVFREKVKPTKWRVIFRVLTNSLRSR